jgi:hypothetical protein
MTYLQNPHLLYCPSQIEGVHYDLYKLNWEYYAPHIAGTSDSNLWIGYVYLGQIPHAWITAPSGAEFFSSPVTKKRTSSETMMADIAVSNNPNGTKNSFKQEKPGGYLILIIKAAALLLELMFFILMVMRTGFLKQTCDEGRVFTLNGVGGGKKSKSYLLEQNYGDNQ